MFAPLLGVSICITLHLRQCSTARFKFASEVDFAVNMQVCISTHELIYFSQVAISCNGGPCLQNIYPVCVFATAPVSADAQFSCIALLHVTSTIQPTAPHCNFLHTTLALHNLTIGFIVCGLKPDKQNY